MALQKDPVSHVHVFLRETQLRTRSPITGAHHRCMPMKTASMVHASDPEQRLPKMASCLGYVASLPHANLLAFVGGQRWLSKPYRLHAGLAPIEMQKCVRIDLPCAHITKAWKISDCIVRLNQGA